MGNISKIKSQIRLAKEFIIYLAPCKRRLLIIIFFSLCAVIMSMLNPFLLKYLIDSVLPAKNIRSLLSVLVISGSAFTLISAIKNLREYLELKTRHELLFALNSRLFSRMQSYPYQWFRSKSAGEMVFKLSSDTSQIVYPLTKILPHTLIIFFRISVSFAIIFYFDRMLAVISILLAPFLYIPHYIFIRILEKAWLESVILSENILNYLQEVFSNILLVKSSGRETDHINEYSRRLKARMSLEIKTRKTDSLSSFTADILNKLVFGIILGLGLVRIISGRLSPGTLGAIITYLAMLMNIHRDIIALYQNTVQGLISCARVSQILNEKPETGTAQEAELKITKGNIEFKNIDFSYTENKNIIKNLNLNIKHGNHVALAGQSGIGKTTLLHLLSGLYEIKSGEILIDNIPVKKASASYSRSQIGYVLQQPLLWNDTIKNNLRYEAPMASDEEITAAARAACADIFINKLPEKYLTHLGGNNGKLSEGEKQKLAIARALVKKPKILLLDEAMSSMDSNSEEKVLENIRRSYSDMTLLTVSHRLSALKKADYVCFMIQNDKMVIDKPEVITANNREFRDLFLGQI
ncbi:MAG TPA: hypothetical protein DC049_16675 [Spirochaetia bacterium]|nr:hypothetical protein [Spirochaetia bacterium]